MGLPWIALMWALYLTGKPTRENLFYFLMVVHYVLTGASVFLMWEGNARGTVWLWNSDRQAIFITAGVYLLGQLLIWGAFFYSRRSSRSLA